MEQEEAGSKAPQTGEREGGKGPRTHSGARTLRATTRGGENRCGRRGSQARVRGRGGPRPGASRGVLSAEQRVAAVSVGGGRAEGPPRKKGREGEAGGEHGRAPEGGEGTRGVSSKTSVQLAARRRWVPGQDSEGDVRGRKTDDRAAGACRLAAGARGEQRREKALQGAGAQPESSGSPRSSLPAPCPSRSAWVGGSGRWTWRRYLRGGNREA